MIRRQNSNESLLQACSRQREWLARADEIVSSLEGMCPSGLDDDGALAELDRILNEASRQSSQLPPLFSALSRDERSDSGVQAMIDSLAEDLKALIGKLDQLAAQAIQARNRLLPEFDQSVRIRQMQNAYQASQE